MKKSEPIIRIILGLLIIISGINKFGHWINVSYMEDAHAFVLDLANIGGGFMIYAIGVLEILIGIALVIDKFKILALLGLIPLMVSIVAFHIFLDLKGIMIALIVFSMNLYLVFYHKEKVANIFAMNDSK